MVDISWVFSNVACTVMIVQGVYVHVDSTYTTVEKGDGSRKTMELVKTEYFIFTCKSIFGTN